MTVFIVMKDIGEVDYLGVPQKIFKEREDAEYWISKRSNKYEFLIEEWQVE